MVSILKIYNKKFFNDSVKVFSNKRHVTFEISHDTMCISSIDTPNIYLSLDNSLFNITHPVSFTIRIDELCKNLNLLDSSIAILDESFKIIDFKGINQVNINENLINFCTLNNNYSFVEIPFTNPINFNYIRKSQFPNRIILPKESLKNFSNGLVQYSIVNGMLILSKQTCEYQETIEITGDVLESGHLNFYCRNDWVESAIELYDLINTVLFCFADGLLSIKFLFKDQAEAYLEIQVPEVDNKIDI